MAGAALRSLFISGLLSSASASLSTRSKENVAVYYGQGPNQDRLTTFCSDDTIDIIILSFVYRFPEQANGYPGINFGNQCSNLVFTAPGYDGVDNPAADELLLCPQLQEDLFTCRQSDKTILLSLGGNSGGYQLTGTPDGTAFADLLWGMFGPLTDTWIAQDGPRPFDFTDASGAVHPFNVDGFDLDIEIPPVDGSNGYIALVKQLRSLYSTDSTKPHYITASPQCIVPDANLGVTLASSRFDMLFIQFYNTPQCAAITWAEANPSYQPGDDFNTAGFTFDSWVSWLATTQSSEIPILITLPGSPSAAPGGGFLAADQARQLASAYYCRPNFGGIAIWDATWAQQSIESTLNFYQNAKQSLNMAAFETELSCV
ncbi:glycoside hydrolase family 18 protein [Xylaria sp. CBS 124048]|nr:glycoside hydrolase family 18 protein [Xylaria sp. CBS 124048]